MKVVEKFISINGEGTRAGELAVFIRFKGCNLNCSYCDTKWANETDCTYEEMSPEDICEYVIGTGVKNVTLTGGEPLLQQDILLLIDHLLNKSDMRVEIETNGAVDIVPIANTFDSERLVFTMDYKLPSSGCEKKMMFSNMDILRKQDTVKFVSGSIEDLECAREIIEEYHLTEKCHVYFSPVFGSIEPVQIVDYMIKHKMNNVRLQIQMHKVIWNPEQRGV
ncbi:MAG: putative 7-carboxy-7-deazaguanine synthase QueE [Lachnospira sp.]|nr:putative 7-carboxy-7-deazaguanine synthase QueE [Lachnospira sp.]